MRAQRVEEEPTSTGGGPAKRQRVTRTLAAGFRVGNHSLVDANAVRCLARSFRRVHDGELDRAQRHHPLFVDLLRLYLLDWAVPRCGRCVVGARDAALGGANLAAYWRRDLGASEWRGALTCVENAPAFAGCGDERCLLQRIRADGRMLDAYENESGALVGYAGGEAGPGARARGANATGGAGRIPLGGGSAGWLNSDGSGFLYIPGAAQEAAPLWSGLRAVGGRNPGAGAGFGRGDSEDAPRSLRTCSWGEGAEVRPRPPRSETGSS